MPGSLCAELPEAAIATDMTLAFTPAANTAQIATFSFNSTLVNATDVAVTVRTVDPFSGAYRVIVYYCCG